MTGWRRVIAPAFLVVLVLASVVWPAAALLPGLLPAVASSRADGPITAAPEVFLGTWPLLGVTMAWVAGPALVATLLGWPLGLALAERLVRGGGRWLLVLSALPVCLPGYLVYWSLWLADGPGSWIGDAAIRAELVVPLRVGTLALALVAWSAPFAAWTIAAWRLAAPDRAWRLRAVDGAGALRRVVAAIRHDAAALLRGWAIATFALLAESVSYDLAQVRTYGYELRTLDATGGSPRDVVALGWPGIAVAIAMLAIASLSRRRVAPGSRSSDSGSAPARWPLVVAILAAVPALLVVMRSLSPHEATTFVRLYAAATMNSLGFALAAGAIVGAIAVAVVLSWRSRSGAARWTARICAALLLIAAASPATLVAVAIEAAWNHDATAWIYDGPAIVVLGLVARFGAVAVIAATLALAAESRSAEALRAIDAPLSWRGQWRVRRPVLVAAGAAACAVGAALAFSEIAVTARVRPPAADVLATSTLNAIHYQQPETVILGSALAVALGFVAAVVAVMMLPRARAGVAFGVVVAAIALAGCGSRGSPNDGSNPPLIPVIAALGGPGFGHGQFHTPRAIAFAPNTQRYFVVDKQARVQRFDKDGQYELEWRMPEWKNGCPVGISIHPDGRVFIADTHYYRVLVFDQDGNELARFGSYGKEPGQFIYPTDIAFGPDGRIYVGEYGSNDRVQIFSADLKPAGQFGKMGTGVGELSRPQTLLFDRERGELYVADSNNHRVVVYDAEGTLLRQFGGPGHGPGELSYPHGLALLGDGTLLVNEFGNHRVQRFDVRPGQDFGKSIGIWGGTGGEVGRLQYPWDIAGVPGRIVVLDSGRDRMLITSLPSALQ
ncbi:MAG: SMP-30/gluconolactonase/LRE family protein [Phycisphaerales bacterium]